MRLIATFAVALCPLIGQSPRVPYGPIGPTFTTDQINYSYQGVFLPIDTVDFRNFTYHIGRSGGGFTLNNGSCTHCCVSALDVVTLRWNGTKFEETGFKTELSGYGRAEGKTLPAQEVR